MSIVGPRPHAVAHNRLYPQTDQGCMIATRSSPASPAGRRSMASAAKPSNSRKMQARIDYDLDYLRNWSLGLDLHIILRTVLVVFRTTPPTEPAPSTGQTAYCPATSARHNHASSTALSDRRLPARQTNPKAHGLRRRNRHSSSSPSAARPAMRKKSGPSCPRSPCSKASAKANAPPSSTTWPATAPPATPPSCGKGDVGDFDHGPHRQDGCPQGRRHGRKRSSPTSCPAASSAKCR